MKEKTKLWIRAAAVRAVRTCAQTAVAAIGVAGCAGNPDWAGIVYTSITAALLSVLTSLAGLPEVKEGEKTK